MVDKKEKHVVDINKSICFAQELVHYGMLVFKNTLIKQNLSQADEIVVYHLALSMWLQSFRALAGLTDKEQKLMDILIKNTNDGVYKRTFN